MSMVLPQLLQLLNQQAKVFWLSFETADRVSLGKKLGQGAAEVYHS